MKKVLLTFALLLTTMVASAQFYTGGGIGFAKSESNNVESTVFTFNPEVGYNIDKNWTVGAVVGVEWKKDIATTISVNPYARYTIFRTGNFSFFADGILELGSIEPDEGDSQFCWGIGVMPGVGYSFTDKVSIAAHIGWLGHRSFDDMGEQTAIAFDGNDLSFSIYYSF